MAKNRIILGLMTFGPDVQWGARTTSLDEFNIFLDYFQAQGYSEVDTARMYQHGQQEAFTAAARWKERGLKLATKLYPIPAGLHKSGPLRSHVEESLRQLETDRVDIFYLHAADRSVPFSETLETVNELYQEGKFEEFGLSNLTSFEVAEIVMTCHAKGWVRPSVYQAMYNALTRSIEPELVAACRRYGLDIVVYNPLAGGLFTGKYKKSETQMNGEGVKDLAFTDKAYRARYLRDSSLEAISIVENAIKPHNLTLVETAFRWLVHHSALVMKKSEGGNDGILIGASSLHQLEQNLKELEKGPLPDDVVKALDQAWLVSKAESHNYWQLELKYGYDTCKELFGHSSKFSTSSLTM